MNGYLALIKEQRNENDNLQQEIERLHSIIKEVREKINKAIINSEIVGNGTLNLSELLEILDKVDKENNKINEAMPVEELEEYEPKNIAEQEYQDWFWD